MSHITLRRRVGGPSNTSYAWLLAGSFTLGAAALLTVGPGTAHADAGASGSDGSRSAGPAAGAGQAQGARSVRGSSASSASPFRSPAAPAAAASGLAAGPAPRATAAARASGPGPTPPPCLQSQSCGTAGFVYSGTDQGWTVPSGVQSAVVTVQGASGGGGTGGPGGVVSATLILSDKSYPSPITSLLIQVGSFGGAPSEGQPGAGGYGGGAPGGSGSLKGNPGFGGGGATTVLANGGPTGYNPVLVAAGGGGDGGDRNGSGGTGGAAGGSSSGSPQPGPDGVWQGVAGTSSGADNAGAGGAGGTAVNAGATSGGDAEDLSGNGGGGGGGAGYGGGSGGQAGQAGLDPFATAGAGGGGGGGSSYANPLVTAFPLAGFQPALGPLGAAEIEWVDILTTSLAPIQPRRKTRQSLLAAFSDYPTNTLLWQVSGGALPTGLTLSEDGELSGIPARPGTYSFQVLVTAVVNEQPVAASVITYTGAVCSGRCNA